MDSNAQNEMTNRVTELKTVCCCSNKTEVGMFPTYHSFDFP